MFLQLNVCINKITFSHLKLRKHLDTKKLIFIIVDFSYLVFFFFTQSLSDENAIMQDI